MFGAKKRRRRRSEMRLGAQAADLKVAVARPAFSVSPILPFWQQRGAKICGIVILAILGWVAYALFSSPSFFVYGAEIRGNVALSAHEIYMAGQVDSQSVFWLNPIEIEQKITALPNVKSATVGVTLPATINIEVVERRPELLWQTGDQIWWVDKEGTIVPPKADIADMLKIIDDDLQPLEAGFQIDPDIIEGAQALRLLAPEVSIIRYTKALGLVVATPEGWPVYLGPGHDMRAKLVVLSRLLPDLREEENSPVYIDLRNPLQPVFKLKPEMPKPVIQIAPLPDPFFLRPRWPVVPPSRFSRP